MNTSIQGFVVLFFSLIVSNQISSIRIQLNELLRRNKSNTLDCVQRNQTRRFLLIRNKYFEKNYRFTKLPDLNSFVLKTYTWFFEEGMGGGQTFSLCSKHPSVRFEFTLEWFFYHYTRRQNCFERHTVVFVYNPTYFWQKNLQYIYS